MAASTGNFRYTTEPSLWHTLQSTQVTNSAGFIRGQLPPFQSQHPPLLGIDARKHLLSSSLPRGTNGESILCLELRTYTHRRVSKRKPTSYTSHRNQAHEPRHTHLVSTDPSICLPPRPPKKQLPRGGGLREKSSVVENPPPLCSILLCPFLFFFAYRAPLVCCPLMEDLAGTWRVRYSLP